MEQSRRRSILKKSPPVGANAKLPRVAAPAVANAFRILDYLADFPRGAGVSEIARSIGISKSSCFNVLATLLIHEAVIKNPRRADWRLGPKLVKLGTAARRGYSYRTSLRQAVQGLVDANGLTCLVGQVLANNQGIVVIDRILPRTRHTDVVTPPIGELYPLTAPAMGRAVLAQLDDDEALLIAGRDPDWSTARSRQALLAKLEEIRKLGYATSIEEYEPTTHAVACLLPMRGNDAGLVLCLVGHRLRLPVKKIPGVAALLSAATRSISDDLLSSIQ